VEMRNRVPRVLSNIEGQSVSVHGNPLLAGNGLCCKEHCDQLWLIIKFQGACIDDVASRHNQHMCGSDRRDVAKPNNDIIFIDSGAWNCPGDNLAEQAVDLGIHMGTMLGTMGRSCRNSRRASSNTITNQLARRRHSRGRVLINEQRLTQVLREPPGASQPRLQADDHGG